MNFLMFTVSVSNLRDSLYSDIIPSYSINARAYGKLNLYVSIYADRERSNVNYLLICPQ